MLTSPASCGNATWSSVEDRPGYRPAIIAGIASALILLDLPPRSAAAILAALGVQSGGQRSQAGLRDRWDDDPFSY